MAADLRSVVRKTWRTLASVETGVVLLITVVILSAVGAIVLQRPVTPPEEMQSAYSPLALRILDTVGLTDVYHSWWFLGLLSLVSLCLLVASVDRLPGRWRYFSRPYKYPVESFRRTAHPQKSMPLAASESDEELGLAVAERALQSRGYNPERVVHQGRLGIFAERRRVSELAVFVVHSGLLLIFFGAFVDGLWGWRGTLDLNEGQSSNMVALGDGKTRTLPFSIRCDSTAREDYKDSTPKFWWSRLVVVRAGQEVTKKEITVNDPLLFDGVHFNQSTYGTSGKVDRIAVSAFPQDGSTPKREIELALNDVVSLDADTSVRFAEFFPDYANRQDPAHMNSNGIPNPAAHLILTSKKSKMDFDVWLPQPIEIANNAKAPWKFQATQLKMGHFTGLAVSCEPGKWEIRFGIALLVFGLMATFYLVHIRIWVVSVRGPGLGTRALWIGGSTNRDRNGFEVRFNDLAASIEYELKLTARSVAKV